MQRDMTIAKAKLPHTQLNKPNRWAATARFICTLSEEFESLFAVGAIRGAYLKKCVIAAGQGTDSGDFAHWFTVVKGNFAAYGGIFRVSPEEILFDADGKLFEMTEGQADLIIAKWKEKLSLAYFEPTIAQILGMAVAAPADKLQVTSLTSGQPVSPTELVETAKKEGIAIKLVPFTPQSEYVACLLCDWLTIAQFVRSATVQLYINFCGCGLGMDISEEVPTVPIITDLRPIT